MPTLLPLEEASRRILARASRTAAEEVALADGLGRVLVQPRIVAPVDVPPFANSAMDGFALRAADTPGVLRLVGEVAAGAAALPSVTHGTAARIMTGAPMPPGADTVVPMELAHEADGVVRLASPTVAGAHVRSSGSDTAAGTEVCLEEALTPAALGVLATLGFGRIQVRRRPVVAVVSTGDELVEPGLPLGPGQIYNSNGVAVAAAVEEAGGEPLILGRLADDSDRIERALLDAARQADLIVTSGGVSVGVYDYVRQVLERIGALDFWRVAVQPGKPLAVGELG
ncbi:MAG: molybdopterin molybdotransferase MoeA, partial [Candidatus Limnocylindria bacterium]